MTIYIIAFILSLICIYIGQKFEESNYSIIAKIFYIIGILIPTILAGIRDYSIGTDVEVYAVPIFKNASEYNSLNDYISYVIASGNKDYLYFVMNFIVSRFTTESFWILFFISLNINLFIFLGWYKCKKKIPIWFGMFLFYFTYYNMSLNAMRQCIAMSIIFYAFSFITEKKVYKYYFWIIIATGFHTSGIISIAFYPFYYLVNSRLISKYRVLSNCTILLGIIILILLIKPITVFLVSRGIFRSNYLNYLSSDVFGGYFNVKILVLNIIELMIIFLPYKFLKNINSKFNFLLLFSIIGFIFSQLTFISTYTNRIAYYFLFIRMYLYGYIPYLFKNKQNKLIFLFGIIVYFVLFWIYNYYIMGLHETMPYKIYLQ